MCVTGSLQVLRVRVSRQGDIGRRVCVCVRPYIYEAGPSRTYEPTHTRCNHGREFTTKKLFFLIFSHKLTIYLSEVFFLQG